MCVCVGKRNEKKKQFLHLLSSILRHLITQLEISQKIYTYPPSRISCNFVTYQSTKESTINLVFCFQKNLPPNFSHKSQVCFLFCLISLIRFQEQLLQDKTFAISYINLDCYFYYKSDSHYQISITT